MGECPGSPFIPIYLVLDGSVRILFTVVVSIRCLCMKKGLPDNKWVVGVVCIAYVIWFGIGTFVHIDWQINARRSNETTFRSCIT